MSRFCPLCDKPSRDAICPVHSVPTLDPSVFQPSSARIGPGTVLGGRYKVERELGSGSVGAVYLGTQLGLAKTVAIKVLRDQVRAGNHVKRFYQEATAISLLNHPNLVGISDFGIDGETHVPYLAMEFVEGVPLKKIIEEEGPLPEARAAYLMSQVARALAAAHDKGIVHRDLKPDNIMVARLADGDEHVKVVDFGMATILTDEGERIQKITATGTTVGTPLYMSPEQIRSSLVDARSDLYSFGCILFELLAGRPPFLGKKVVEVMSMHLKQNPPPLPPALRDGKPPSEAIARMVSALLQKAREQRPRSASEIAVKLGRLGTPTREAYADASTLTSNEAATEGPDESFRMASTRARPEVLDLDAGPSESATMLAPSDYGELAGADAEELRTRQFASDGSAGRRLGATPHGLSARPSAGVSSDSTEVGRSAGDPRRATPAPAVAASVEEPTHVPTVPLLRSTPVSLPGSPLSELTRSQPAQTGGPGRLLVLAGVAVVAGLAVFGIMVAREREAPSDPVTVLAAPPIEAAKVEPRVEGVSPARPAEIRVTSSPDSASVYRAGEFIGLTPVVLPRPPTAESREYALRKDGFLASSVVLSAESPDRLNVELAPLPPESKPAPNKVRPPRPTRPKKDEPPGAPAAPADPEIPMW